MKTNITIRPAIDEEDRRRLREFIGATLGARGLMVLDTHLARARYCTDFTLLAESDSILIGCVLLRHVRLQLGAALIEAAEIERLIIHQIKDTQLLVSLIDTILKVCADQGLTLLLLHAEEQPYRDLGFAPFGLHSLLWIEAQAPAAGPIDHRVEFVLRPLNERLDGPADLGPLYDLSYAGLALVEERKRTDWRGWPGVGVHALVLEDRHELTVGYVVLDSNLADGMMIYEAALAAPAYAPILLQLLGELAYSRGFAGFSLHLPDMHLLIREAKSQGAIVRDWRLHQRGEQLALGLCGIVELQAFLSQILPELERRVHASAYAHWYGTVALQLENDAVMLHIDGAHIQVDELQNGASCTIQLASLASLTQLLLGSRRAAELAAEGELHYQERYADLIDVLFSSHASGPGEQVSGMAVA